jgi:hypothetical protein
MQLPTLSPLLFPSCTAWGSQSGIKMAQVYSYWLGGGMSYRWGTVVVWFRISSLALLIAGALSLLLIPMWGRHIALASVALIIMGAATLAVGTRLRRFRDSESGGVYGDASGLNTDCGGGHHHGGDDGGHGSDGGDGGGH